MGSSTARRGRGPAGLGLVLAALVVLAALPALAGCAAPQFTYIADSSASTYFKVPYGWHALSSSQIASVLTGGKSTTTPSGVWAVGYDGGATAAVSHVLSPAITQPIAFAVVLQPTLSQRASLTTDGLRDFFFPVSRSARQSAALQGFRLSGFRLLHDSVLSPGRGIHGVRDVFDYRYPDGHTDTFDQVAFTNSGRTEVYVLLVHCMATCYRTHRSEINTVMSSFMVGS